MLSGEVEAEVDDEEDERLKCRSRGDEHGKVDDEEEKEDEDEDDDEEEEILVQDGGILKDVLA